jgi:hypothetical protein
MSRSQIYSFNRTQILSFRPEQISGLISNQIQLLSEEVGPPPGILPPIVAQISEIVENRQALEASPEANHRNIRLASRRAIDIMRATQNRFLVFTFENENLINYYVDDSSQPILPDLSSLAGPFLSPMTSPPPPPPAPLRVSNSSSDVPLHRVYPFFRGMLPLEDSAEIATSPFLEFIGPQIL